MKRHHLNRLYLEKECHRLGPPAQVCLLRSPSPVRCVSQSSEIFCTCLNTKEQIGGRKHTHVGNVGNSSISLQTFNSTRGSTLGRNPSDVMWGDPRF